MYSPRLDDDDDHPVPARPPARTITGAARVDSSFVDPTAEIGRQAAVEWYGLAGPEPWRDVDVKLKRLAEVVQRVTGIESASIDILDEHRVWSVVVGPDGLSTLVSPRAVSICEEVLSRSATDELLLLDDPPADPVLAKSPWINGDAGSIRFYAALPLVAPDGHALGAVSMWSESPATITEEQHDALRVVRDAVMRHLESQRPVPEPLVGVDQAVTPALADQDWTIEAIIRHRAVQTVFQPVVHLASGATVGFEALTRGPAGSPLESPIALIDAARQSGRLAELDWLCRVQAMRAAASAGLPPTVVWLINVEPAGLMIECPEYLRAEFTSASAKLRIVLEIVERDLEGRVLDLVHAATRAKESSWGLALDDIGADKRTLALIPLLRPDIVKLDLALVQAEPSSATASIISAVRGYAERTGALILAEGVETEAHAELARIYGATYAQGRLYGDAAPLPAELAPPEHAIRHRPRRAWPSTGTPFETLVAMQQPQQARESMLRHISRYLEDQSERDEDASVLMACFPQRKAFVVVANCLEFYSSSQYRSEPFVDCHGLADEWAVIVMNPHFAGAFVAREAATGRSAQDDRTFDFVYTFDRESVAAAAEAFLGELDRPGPVD